MTNNNKAILIAVGIFVVLAGIVGWTGLIFVIMHTRVSTHMTVTQTGSPGQTPDVSGYDVKFGIMDIDASKRPFLSKETTTIPLKLKDSGFEYGIMITPPDDKPYRYQMVFHFSAAPKVITGNGFESSEPSDTMRTPVTGAIGCACDEYWFDEGDPMGDQSVDVYVNGQLVKTIKYTVVAPDDATSGT